MEKLDLNNMKLPLSKKRFSKLRKAIRTGRVKWMEMSEELMYSYQDFWKSEKYKNMEKID
ncbi:hypothetical protein [Lutibacter sp.]|uniref:hypothetical protein n=1 Tax=Lutibacter sp. TaxID=1925666 RepID=UPI0025C40724|nr:hypothetical protein [Lutibacter sp.]